MYKWLHTATPDQHKALAKAAKTSVGHLKHIAFGRRGVTAELAIRIAAASYTLKVLALRLDQRDLCPACGTCPFAAGEPMPAPTTILRPPVKGAKANGAKATPRSKKADSAALTA